MTLTLTYVVKVMALSNLQQVLAVARPSLKSYNHKKIVKIIMNFRLFTRIEAYVIVSTVSYGFVLTVHDILLFTFYKFQCSFSTILKHSQCDFLCFCIKHLVLLSLASVLYICNRNMFLHEFINLTYNYEELLIYLCSKKVIRSEVKCPRCENIVKLDYNSSSFIMHCKKSYFKYIHGRKRKKQTCNFKISALHKTWFSKSHLEITKICRFISYFLMFNPPRYRFLMTELEITNHTVVDWTNFCRELLLQWFERDYQQIGNSGSIVEIDEVKIGKRKHHKGRVIEGQWLFGGYERDSGKIFIVPVKDRRARAETLIPLIRHYIAPGSIIYTDCWRAYDKLSEENYIHKTVNHSENFVNPITGVHTQNIERLWRDLRAGLPRYGTRTEHYKYYLGEFFFKREYNFLERIDKFFNIMASMYPISIEIPNSQNNE